MSTCREANRQMSTKVGVTAAAFLPRNAMYSADCAVACMMLAGYSACRWMNFIAR